ncbi:MULTISPECIES: TonB-dependent siderophore receptor [Pseudoalteromonas]|uniref:TonB-dependent siderophore receptor n=1 Tax=Pseudoalteromonas TaxID=53246 RepID=UPI0002E4F61D|nr:iron complex outermembrane recepter protein [Pseudoalteromonas mariniglutinosa NCIMB 1770]
MRVSYPIRLNLLTKAILTVIAVPFGGFVSFQSQAADDIESIEVFAQALKIDTPAQETPKAVSILTKEELAIRAPQKLDEALRYTSGVTVQPYGADNDTDWFKVRGFDAATYLDGNRLFRDGYYTWLLEPFGLQQVEVVKGPSAILFGEAPPGGVVNAVLKKPSYAPPGEIRLEVGNNNLKSIGLDVSGQANESNSMRYRMVGLLKSNDGELNGSQNDRIYFAPSLEIDISNKTIMTLMATYLKDDGTPTNPFFPAAGTVIDTPYGQIDPATNLGEPDYDKYKRSQMSVGYSLEHTLNDTWVLSQKFNYGHNDLFLRSAYAFPNSDPQATQLYRGIVFRDGNNQSVTLDNKAVANWNSARLEHTLLAGIDLQYHETNGDEQDNYSFGTIDPWQPEYGNYTALDSANNIDREISKSQVSAYSQYQVKFDSQWIALVGARYDEVKTDNQSNKLAQQQSQKDDQLSLNAGVMYLAESGLSPYASYAQSFEVLSTIDPATGELYKPLEGEQVELGVKYQPSFIDGYINASWFDITQENALVTNPATFVATQTGEVSSQGIELETVTQASQSVKLTASYTYTDATTDDTAGQGTKQAGLIPKNAASVWVDYDASFAGINGLNIGSGLRYMGESKDSPASSDLTVKSATLWDAVVSYSIAEQWQLQLNVNNILDKEYVSACDYYCYYGQSRSVVLSANYRF